MQLSLMENRSPHGYSTFGSYWSEGEVSQPSFTLFDEKDNPIPAQSRVTARWPDGSIKWAAHTADAAELGANVRILPLGKPAPKKNTPSLLQQRNGKYIIDTGALFAIVPAFTAPTSHLLENISLHNVPLAKTLIPVFHLETRESSIRNDASYEKTIITECIGKVTDAHIEENGPLHTVIRFHGTHTPQEKECQMPFVLRLAFYKNSAEIKATHTFFYDGKEDQHFLKGMGLQLSAVLSGRPYQRHIQFATDRNSFHEAAILLNSSYPRLAPKELEQQVAGKIVNYPPESDVEKAATNLPIWNHYTQVQSSASHHIIKKRTQKGCCSLPCLEGRRAPGVMAIHGVQGGVLVGMKDFWQKYPSGLETSGLNDDITRCTAWFYSPETSAFDFRHYDTRSYQMTSYEGFPELGADPYGIAVTSECSFLFTSYIPDDALLQQFHMQVQKPALYIAAPTYYHSKRAFGYWSLVKKDNEAERWLEKQLETIFDFYKNEIDSRNWYGLFDYGDFMHTYDSIRHCWRYDMGGFAWQNTELVPTYWLWLYFLRTGREDVFTIAEAMSRHCSEVDFYHFGPLKGIGSRHNVSHWGCSCKEPRVSMAGHHRPYYYLTGDYRMEDIFDDVKDADFSMKEIKHYLRKIDGKDSLLVRTGPDWSSFVSNWMTEYERTLDESYREKIEQGIKDIAATPLGLTSGPEFLYIAESSQLIYQGEDDTAPNMHLQVSMGGPQVWFETADMLDNKMLQHMLVRHGELYYLSPSERSVVSEGLLKNRSFGFPYFASSLGAYSAYHSQDSVLAKKVWAQLLYALVGTGDFSGFYPQIYARTHEGKALYEIPWIKTNFVAQWCLNIIIALEFIPDDLPKTKEESKALLSTVTEGHFHIA